MVEMSPLYAGAEWSPDQRVVSGNLCSAEEQAVSVEKEEEKAKWVEMYVIND